MLEVADVLRRYGEEYLAAFGEAMLPSHRRAFQDILQCRTPAMGGHLFACDQCGYQQYAYHSCRNRHCPKCHRSDTDAWKESSVLGLVHRPSYATPGGRQTPTHPNSSRSALRLPGLPQHGDRDKSPDPSQPTRFSPTKFLRRPRDAKTLNSFSIQHFMLLTLYWHPMARP